jgi:hypothetical protein
VGSEQWVAETEFVAPPTRVFLEKRLQVVENKGQKLKKKVERLQAIDKTRVRAAATGKVREVSSR